MAANAALTDPVVRTSSWKNGIDSHMGVFTPPGHTALTRMGSPASMHSLAAARVNMHTAALLVAYALDPAGGRIPDAEETFTILPPFARMARIAYFVPRKTPSRLTAITRRHSASVMSGRGQA